jgi:hypothetical protein
MSRPLSMDCRLVAIELVEELVACLGTETMRYALKPPPATPSMRLAIAVMG